MTYSQCEYDEIPTPKLCYVIWQKGFLKIHLTSLISWCKSIKREISGKLLKWAQSNHISHLKVVFSDWQHKGKARNSKHQNDSLCHSWLRRWRQPCVKVGRWQWHLNWQSSRKRGLQSRNCRELNFAKKVSESGSISHSNSKPVQWVSTEWNMWG